MAKLNPQGLARKDATFMRCIVPDDGYVTVSMDLASGEPTVTSHFSQDANYMYACFDGVGKTPHYRNGVLMIDDIYLMCMSVSPIGRDLMAKTFDSHVFNGLTFVEQWKKDPDIIKSYFKKERQLHKMLCLALGYSMGPKKMVKQCYDNGIDLSISTAKSFFSAYWDLFSGVRKLGNRLEAEFKSKGYLVNPFGYRLVPDKSFKSLNYFIQSSVSGIMHVFVWKLMAIAPYARFVTVIHDELIADVPVDRIEEFRAHKDLATQSLNDDLRWSVNIRTGFAVGNNWYEAK